MFQDLSEIKDFGFLGFKSIQQLWNDYSVIPDVSGVYVVINPDMKEKRFLPKGTGGFFKGKDPNISQEELKGYWIDNCLVIYIGKAGGSNSSATLRKRIKQYLDFGKGKPVGHYGGRLIWQLVNSKDLIIAWKILKQIEPRNEEQKLLNEFVNIYGKLPFANLKF